MSEAIQPEQSPYPGEAWTEIVRRPTLEEFSRAFASDVVLEASVVSRPIVGPIGLRAPSIHGPFAANELRASIRLWGSTYW
jgi:hypothetical protein